MTVTATKTDMKWCVSLCYRIDGF